MSFPLAFSFPFLAFLAVFHPASTLYEDQVGKFDWKQQYVGKVKFSGIDLISKWVYVATESNVIAALSLDKGEIIWRQILETGSGGSIRAFHVDTELITVSGSNPVMVRGWNPLNGILSYEWILQIGEWVEGTQVSFDHNKLYILKPGDSYQVSSYSLRNGHPSVSTSLAEPDSSHVLCTITCGKAVCVKELWKLQVTDLSSGSNSTIPIDSLSSFPISMKALPSSCFAIAMTLYGETDQVVVYNIESNSIITSDFPSSLLSDKRSNIEVFAVSNSKHILIDLEPSNGGLVLHGKVMESGEPISNLNGKKVDHSYPLSRGFISSVACNTEGTTCYILYSCDDGIAVLLRSNRVLWVREEALSRIVSVEMIELPMSDVEVAIEKEFASKEGGLFGMMVRRLLSQSYQLKDFFFTLMGFKGPHINEDGRVDMVKDPFGLRKLIVVVTETCKVYGIDNDNGEIVWQFRVDGVVPLKTLGEVSIPLFVQRTTRHAPYPALCTLLFKMNDRDALYVFNPVNGHKIDKGLVNLDFRVGQAMLLPTVDEDFTKGLLLLSTKGEVHVHPKTSLKTAKAIANSVFMYTVDRTTGAIVGYSIGSNLKNVKADAVSWPARQLWNLLLPGKIMSVVAKNPLEKVHSQGRVLSDRSVLYKYVNPNLVAVSTHAVDSTQTNMINVFLIDVVKGAIIFSMVHKRATEPSHIVHSENWVVYSYLNDKSRRTEIVTLELYEGKNQTNATAFSSLAPLVRPLVERQAYIYRYNIMTMRETITEKGITSKHLLVGLETGGVMEVPWALLDPRRPVSPTPEMREEGVVPYIPELDLPPETIITYNHTLPNIAGIHTSPSGLESTCLVFVYGLDLFYTRVAPSKTFDVLKDDFEYWLIFTVLVGLVAAAYITRKLASRKALKQAWK